MPDISTQAVLPYNSGIPEDVAVNTWFFRSTSGTAAELGELAHEALTEFYAGWLTLISPITARQNFRTRSYDMADPQPRTPVYDELMGFTAASTGTPLPSEVAVCLSFRAALESGTNPARRRGRVYLGPLNQTVISNASGTPRVDTSAINLIYVGLTDMLAELDAVAGRSHMVYSRTNGTMHAVDAYYIDNAFDTQRRRGRRADTRSPYVPI